VEHVPGQMKPSCIQLSHVFGSCKETLLPINLITACGFLACSFITSYFTSNLFKYVNLFYIYIILLLSDK